MFHKSSEKGQALIIIALAAVILVGFSALAIDGARAFEDKRHAQNAADTAVMAAAVTYTRALDQNNPEPEMEAVAYLRAADNGYDNNNPTNNVTVTVTIEDAPAGDCPYHLDGKIITVEIVTTINTTFARVLGRQTMTSTSIAVSQACGYYAGPPFPGNAIVALQPSGIGFDAKGTPDWDISGGGIFVNSSDGNAADCGGAADVTAPSVTAVGGTGLGACYTGPPPITGAAPYSYSDITDFFPREPSCNGVAYQSGGKWYPAAGADGSTVTWNSDMDFAPGLYCVTNSSPGPFHSDITGDQVTFYISDPNFELDLNGGGTVTATAPLSGEYKGILFYLKPVVINGVLQQTQELGLQGNGTGSIVGTILAPSASVTMFGNSGTGAFNSQIIAYNVDSGGNANITINYNPNNNFNFTTPYTLSLLE